MIQVNLVYKGPEGVINTDWVAVNYDIFKGGEVNPILPDMVKDNLEEGSTISIKAHLKNSDDSWALMMTVDAIRRINPSIRITLLMPYVPYARQDRVCNPGEAIGIAMFASVINLLELDEVFITDPHSDATPALIKRSRIIKPHEFIVSTQAGLKDALQDLWIVAPDAGAQKKVKGLAKSLGSPGYFTASKERDLETLEITGTRFDGDPTGKHLLVVDDICDGGRTFIALAKELKKFNPASITLFVTHGIFSYGTEVVTEHFDLVITTNSFQPTAHEHVDGSGNTNPKMLWLSV